MVLVMAMSATALATTVILEVDDVKNTFLGAGPPADRHPGDHQGGGRRRPHDPPARLRRPLRGQEAGLKPRSDTMLLVRADPNKDAIAVMSIPRDLKAEIPGYGTRQDQRRLRAGRPAPDRAHDQEALRGRDGRDVPDQQRHQRQLRRPSGARSTTSAASTSTSTATTSTTTRAAASATRRSTSTRATRSSRARTRWTTSATATRTTTSSAPPASRTSCARRATCPASRKLFSVGDRKRAGARLRPLLRGRQGLPLQQGDLLDAAARRCTSCRRTRASTRSASAPPSPTTRTVDTRLFTLQRSLKKTVDEFMNAKSSSKPTKTAKPTAADEESARLRKKRNRNKPAQVPGPRGGARPGRRPGRARRPEAQVPVLLPAPAHHAAPPTPAPSRASTRSATSRARSTRPTGSSSPRAWPASTTASRA